MKFFNKIIFLLSSLDNLNLKSRVKQAIKKPQFIEREKKLQLKMLKHFKAKVVHILLILSLLTAHTQVACLDLSLESPADLEVDYKFCMEKFPSLPQMIKAYDPEADGIGSNSTGTGKFSTLLVTESNTIAYFLFPDIQKYITSNILVILPQLGLLFVVGLGLLSCIGICLFSCCMKERFILNDEQIVMFNKNKMNPYEKMKLGIISKKKYRKMKQMEQNEKKGDKWGDDSSSERQQLSEERKTSSKAINKNLNGELDEYDLDEEFTEAEKVEYLSDKKDFEFKILFGLKIFFTVVLVGLVFFFDLKFDPFFDQYLETSCKFTYMSHLILDGGKYDQKSETDFKTFIGLKGMNSTLQLTDAYFENTTITSTEANLRSFISQTNYGELQASNIYFARLNDQVYDANNGTTSNLPYVEYWGPPDDPENNSGELTEFTSLLKDKWGNLRAQLSILLNSPLSWFQEAYYGESKTNNKHRLTSTEIISEIQNKSEVIEKFYEDISGSFMTKTYFFSKNNNRVILYIVYGCLLLIILVGLLLECLFKKKRTSWCLKLIINFMWVLFGLISLLFAILLNIIIPVSSAMKEFSNMIEPMIFNSSFYSNLEWPELEFKTLIGNCLNHQIDPESFFLGYKDEKGDFFNSIQTTFNALDGAITASQTAEISQVRTNFSSFATNLGKYGSLRTGYVAYNVSAQGASNEMLEYLNAITNCGNGPVAGTGGLYSKYSKNINHLTNCGSTCRTTDVWVWDSADCPLGSTSWTGTEAVDTSVSHCLSFDNSHDTNSDARSRYFVGCVDPVSGSDYPTLVTNLLTQMRLHYNSMATEFTSAAGLKTVIETIYSNTFFTAQESTASSLNTELTGVKSALSEFESKFITDADTAIIGNRNCSFVKQTFLESKDTLVELKTKMELIGFLALGCLGCFFIISSVSFTISQCCNRISPQEYSEKEIKNGGRFSNDQNQNQPHKVAPLLKTDSKEKSPIQDNQLVNLTEPYNDDEIIEEPNNKITTILHRQRKLTKPKFLSKHPNRKVAVSRKLHKRTRNDSLKTIPKRRRDQLSEVNWRSKSKKRAPKSGGKQGRGIDYMKDDVIEYFQENGFLELQSSSYFGQLIN